MKPVLETEPLVLHDPPTAAAPEICVVVTVTERVSGLSDIYDEYSAVLRDAGYEFGFLFVAEPHYDSDLEPLRARAALGEPIRIIVARRSMGGSALLRAALPATSASIVVTLPSYRQVEARGILALIQQVAGDTEMAVARRTPRKDAWINRVQNWVFNVLQHRLMRSSVSDIGCGVRAFKRTAVLDVPLYGDYARFLPLIALYNGVQVVEVPVPQHAADTGTRVYTPGVYLRRVLDLFGLFFLLRFTYKPLRFFGLIGSVFAFLGVVLLLILLVQRAEGQSIVDRPLVVLSALLTTLGIQSIALGLIGEMIVHFSAPGRASYKLRGETPGEHR